MQLGSSAATPVTSTNTSPVSGRTSVFQQQNEINAPSDGSTKDNSQPTTSNLQVNVVYIKNLNERFSTIVFFLFI